MQESTRTENKKNDDNSQFSIPNSQLGVQSKPSGKPLNLLGMAKKAGLIAIGSEAVKTLAREGKVELIILATDTSEGSARQARYSAEDSGAICIDTPYTKFELGNVTGRGSPGTVAFFDLGLAAEFMKRLSELDKTRYGETAKEFEIRAKALKANNQPTKRRTKI